MFNPTFQSHHRPAWLVALFRKTHAAAVFSLSLLLMAGCGGGNVVGATGGGTPPVDGPVNFLTSTNLSGTDDDPAVAMDPQGNIHVVWFSDRDGTNDLYATHSTAIDLASGNITWAPPIHITDNAVAQFPLPTGDNFPSLFIDSSGTHHLAWHRTDTANQAHILYAQSDGTAAGWAAAKVVSVTTGANFDRFANVVRVSANDLRIFFVSHTRVAPLNKDGIFVAKSTDNGATWPSVAEVTTLNSTIEQTSLPSVLRLTSGLFTATFQRFKLNPANDVLDPSNDIFYAESPDGDIWSATQVTSDPNDNKNDLAPSFFLDHAGAPHLAWGTTFFGDPSGDLVQMKVSDRAGFPNLVTHLTSTLGLPDHSPRLAAVTAGTSQVFVMVWVRTSGTPHDQVVYRVFSTL